MNVICNSCMHIYIYLSLSIYIYIFIFICIYRERARERIVEGVLVRLRGRLARHALETALACSRDCAGVSRITLLRQGRRVLAASAQHGSAVTAEHDRRASSAVTAKHDRRASSAVTAEQLIHPRLTVIWLSLTRGGWGPAAERHLIDMRYGSPRVTVESL